MLCFINHEVSVAIVILPNTPKGGHKYRRAGRNLTCKNDACACRTKYRSAYISSKEIQNAVKRHVEAWE